MLVGELVENVIEKTRDESRERALPFRENDIEM